MSVRPATEVLATPRGCGGAAQSRFGAARDVSGLNAEKNDNADRKDPASSHSSIQVNGANESPIFVRLDWKAWFRQLDCRCCSY
jgi:hypothetical protein